MKTRTVGCGVSIATLMLTGVLFVLTVSATSKPIPVWAYGTDPATAVPGGKAQPGRNVKQLPATDLKFTEAQIQDPFGPADWFPGDHAVMPNIVAHGRKPTIWACALCHYPNGKGVVETDTVPKTRTSVGMYLPIAGAGKEELGQRIIEVPADPEGTEVLRNPHSAFVAYVPVGSIQKGKELVTNGGKRTSPCGVCHGVDLNGLGPVPGIAGRSPSYVVRQLYDMQQGTRNGTWTELMKSVVRNLNEDDMLNIAAYVSSLQP